MNHKILFTAVLLAVGVCAPAAAQKKVSSNGYPYAQVPFTQVKIDQNSFLGQRVKAAHEVTIPLAFSKCEETGRYLNFNLAAQHVKDAQVTHPVPKSMIFPFDDTDVYKTIEGASYVLQTYPDARLGSVLMRDYISQVLDTVAAAQESDGYLYTARTINPAEPHNWSGPERWSQVENMSHELYNLGHMVDAACAHYQATGSTQFLDIAKRFADCVIREVSKGKKQAYVVPGHEIAEMALARLYVLTGEKKYLTMAKYFVEERGRTKWKTDYSQCDKPIVELDEATGHAVRAGYYYAGVADVAALTGDKRYIAAIDRIWNNIVGKKYYLTGGIGALHDGEKFGANYELPNLSAYNETCAAISMVYLAQRMFMLHGKSEYIDVLERTLYNGVLAGMSLDGGRFFYPNPLTSDGRYAFNADNTLTRQPWFGCACCPSNLSRFIPSLPGYFYAVRGKELYVNLFGSNASTINVGRGEVQLEQQTNYPWDGDVTVRVNGNTAGEFTLMVRVPGWVRGEVVPTNLYSYADNRSTNPYVVKVNGETITTALRNGYMPITRKWQSGDVVSLSFDMQPRTVKASELIEEDRGLVAVERGPLVYCAEWADNANDVFHYVLADDPKLSVEQGGFSYAVDGKPHTASFKSIAADADYCEYDAQGLPVLHKSRLTLIPYYAWNHRGAGKMEVWMAAKTGAVDKLIKQVNEWEKKKK